MDKLLYIDDAAGVVYRYEQLRCDVEQVMTIAAVHTFADGYELFVAVVAAVANNAQLVLLPEAGINVGVELRRGLGEVEESSDLGSSLSFGPSLSFWGEHWGKIVQESRGELGIMTSGSTGAPKLVWHGLDSLTRGVRIGEQHADDVWGLAYHPAHFAGLQVLFQALANQNTLVRLFGLEPAAVQRAIEQHQVTHLSATPTFLNLLCTQDSCSHPAVKRITTGGERLPAPLIHRIARMFPNAKLTNVYASTETGSLLAGDGEYFTVPQALQTKVRIIDGELAVHQSLLAKSLRTQGTGRIDGEFFLTGDQVEQLELVNDTVPVQDTSASGIPAGESSLRFRFLGRRQDEINVGGLKVNPLEVEELLLAMDEVAGARVYGRANSVTGYLVACDLMLQPSQSLSTLQIRERLSPVLASYKLPRIVNIVDSLPTTYSGKQARLN